MKLTGYELELSDPLERARYIQDVQVSQAPALLLDTCQRIELYGNSFSEVDGTFIVKQWDHVEAFERLARIAAGLESRILGELEVLGQVRAAYKRFHKQYKDDHALLDRIFQDAIALARKARKASEIDKNLTSLSGLAARELLTRTLPGEPLAVIGSGSLAGSVTRYLGKRGNAPIRVSSRCPDKALNLALEVGGFSAGLDELSHLLEGVSGIITATAAPHPIIYPQHLASSSSSLTIIDLGVPPDCEHGVTTLPGLTYMDLREIEARAHINTSARKQAAQRATRIIRDGAMAWSQRN